MREDAPITSTRLVLVPAVITLAITLLRLVGELQNWSPRFFSRAAGGGAAVVGISWLVPLFGLWFGWKLARAGRGPRAVGRAFGLTIAALVLLPALGFAAAKLGIGQQSLTTLFVYVGGSIVGIAIGLAAWPELGRTLLVYALAARVPVALVMLAAIFGNWGTHYDVAPPGFSATMSPVAKWFLIGFIPQMTIWIWFTIVIGSLFGIVAGLAGRRRAVSAPAA